MKMVKSLLLGSAAGLVAVAGAQAADLPVKAKPVQYVKICSLYGVGFYYIPGTDMCIKIGGWVRAEYAYGTQSSFASGPFNGINQQDRNTNNSLWRARGYITADARNQTEYGTVRGYIALGLSTNNFGIDGASNTFSANRAFIQWAGFTFGLAQSFYDFYSNAATSYWGFFPSSDTGDPGWLVAGYTAQFGNGFSGTIAAEMRRESVINNLGGTLPFFINAAGVPVPTGGTLGSLAFTTGYGGFNAPDVVGNLRVDQAWGSAQIMGAAHEVNTGYYAPSFGFPGVAAGAPDNKWGYAAGIGLKLNTPWLFQWWGMTGVGDYLQAQVNYTHGALRYIFFNQSATNYGMRDGDGVGFGFLQDAVYSGVLNPGTPANVASLATNLQLTTAWNVNAAYEHFWSPRWRTSLYGGYAEVKYGDAANFALCTFTTQPFSTSGAIGTTNVAGIGGCDNDWKVWWIGSRTQWNVTKDFYMGLDVLYSKLQSASTQNGLVNNTVLGLPSGNSVGVFTPYHVGDQDIWSFRFRVHRDFYP
jgi:Porin subfamily